MSYGPCRACPMAVAAWMMSQNAIEAVPECVLLCVDHLRALLKDRAGRVAKAEREANRRYCACGNEIYLFKQRDGVTRDVCQRCNVPYLWIVGRNTEVTPVSLRIHEDWYSAKTCDEPECAAKMVWHYPATGRTCCAKHGATAEPEGAHA